MSHHQDLHQILIGELRHALYQVLHNSLILKQKVERIRFYLVGPEVLEKGLLTHALTEIFSPVHVWMH